MKTTEGPRRLWEALEAGKALEDRFPGQDAIEFAMAMEYTGAAVDWQPDGIATFEMLEEGCGDGPDWVWIVETAAGERWKLTAGCDYTGWDCQSSWGEWERVADAG